MSVAFVFPTSKVSMLTSLTAPSVGASTPAPDCPRTLDLVGRAVHVDVPPLLDERDLDELELALRKVALGVLV